MDAETFSKFANARYRRNGRVWPEVDCWGFVLQLIKADSGTFFPELSGRTFKGYSEDLALLKDRLDEVTAPQAGDLIAQFQKGWLRHVGYLLDNGRVAHIEATGIKATPLKDFQRFAQKTRAYRICQN